MKNSDIPKHVHIVGWVGTFTACCMYIFYLPQIWDNLHGHITSPWQPAAATVNCIFWVWYAVRIRNWPVAISNAPGILFGFIAFFTAL